MTHKSDFWKTSGVVKILFVSFPTLCSAANSKGVEVAEVWMGHGEEAAWNPRFARHFNDWEMEMILFFWDPLSRERVDH